MSKWTHVAAIIRFDALRPLGMGRYPQLDTRIPSGSEGPLQYHVWTNPENHHAAAYTAMIWGDLRDYSDPDKIIEYLNRVCEKQIVRSGVAKIDVEYQQSVVAIFKPNEDNPYKMKGEWKLIHKGEWKIIHNEDSHD